MLANVPRRHVRQYKRPPIVITPTSSTLPSPGPHCQIPESDNEDGIDTLVSSPLSLGNYKDKMIVLISGEDGRKPLPPTFEFKSAQPLSLNMHPNLPRGGGATTTPGVGLPKRRTLAQRFRERTSRRCIQTFPVDAEAPWHLALADPNLDGLDQEAEEEGFDTVIRILQSEEDDYGLDGGESRDIRRQGGRIHVRSGKGFWPSPKPTLDLCTSREEDPGCTRTEIHVIIPHDASDTGVTALTLAQMIFVSQYPDLGKVLLTTPPERGVDAISLAAFCFATPRSLPGEMIRAFNEFLDTPLDIPADEASWKWRGAVSWDGLEALDDVYTDDTMGQGVLDVIAS